MKHVVRLGAREQAPWLVKRERVQTPTADNIEGIIRESELEDEMRRMCLSDPDEHIRYQLKRRRVHHPSASVSYEDVVQQVSEGTVPTLASNEETEYMPPDEFGVVLKSPYSLYPHQKSAVRWCLDRESQPVLGIQGGVLSLEMGLGKTLLSLVLSRSTWEAGQCATLVVMPKTLMTNYMLDIAKFFGRSVTALIWDRTVLGNRFYDFSVDTPYKNNLIIVSYDTVLGLAKSIGILSKGKSGNAKMAPVAEIFYRTPWFRVICDESHRFANHKCQLWDALCKIRPGRRMCLTGTAVRNYEDDLFSQLKFCGLSILPDHREWTIQNYKLHDIQRAVFCRSMAECDLDMPEREEVRHYVELSDGEKEVYNVLMRNTRDVMEAFRCKDALFANVLEMFTRLRQACIAPHLITPQCKSKRLTSREQDRMVDGVILGPEHVALERSIRSPHGFAGLESAKMRETVRIAKSIPEDEKMLIFSEWSSAARLVAAALVNAFGEEAVVLVDGDTKDKDAVFSRFKLDSKVRFLCCTSVATHGLTLIEANHALTLSTSWNSATVEQFYARIWRIGQTRKCFMWQLIVKGSVESNMLDVCEKKHSIRDILLSQGLNADSVGAFLGDNID